MTANNEYMILLKRMVNVGTSQVMPRGLGTQELVGHVTCIDMHNPIITISERNLDYNFMAAEAHWILRGSRSLDHPSLQRNLVKYSDDGQVMNGAYGPPFIEQLEYVVRTLSEDRDSRQAVITMWDRSPKKSKDIPCTVSLQFMIRKGWLYTNASMRSSDVWLGWPYDIFSFTMMTHMVRVSLSMGLDMGELRIFAGSQHLYNNKVWDVKRLIDSNDIGENWAISNTKVNTPDDIMKCLDTIRNARNDQSKLEMRSQLCQ